jgi:BNR repeat protein
MLRSAAILVSVLAASGYALQTVPALRVTPLDSPAGANSAEPRMSVSSKGVLLSWIERNGVNASLKFSERSSAGWSAPKTVASGNDWFVNWADVPSVVRLGDGTLVAHWLRKNATSSAAYDIRLSRSMDDGKTWSAPATPHHDNAAAEHGFASMFPTPAGGVGVVWLDGRAAAGHAGHDMSAGPSAAATALRFSTFDRTGKQAEETVVDARVCDCCPTAAAITADGPIVAFRDRSSGEIRDISVSRLVGGKWTEPSVVHHDNWNITGCPVNGPALAARDGQVAIAWFTGAEKQNRAFVALSKDAGKTFGAPIRLDDKGTLGRVDLALLDDGSVVGAWIEYQTGAAAELRLRRIQPSGERSAAVTVAPIGSDRAAGFPRLAGHGTELVMAWTDKTQVRTAIASVK